MPAENTAPFLDAVARELGEAALDRGEAERSAYGRHTLPGPDLPPPGIIYPGSTEDVQAVVRLANQYRVPLFPISAGWNLGIGSRAAMNAGQVVVALGRRMNKVVEVNDDLSYVVVEPGVSFNTMYDELNRRGSKLMMSPTAGPPDGSVLGNAIDKGGGAGPLASHFDNLCGMEVVLGNGDIIRTGDGGIDADAQPNWHVTKYSFGPALDGIFTQSNYGIVTRAGIWMMQRPPHIRMFFFTFPDDEDLAEIVDLIRPIKAAGVVPTQIRATNDLYLLSSQERHPRYDVATARAALSDGERAELRKKYGIGSWTVSGALYGPNDEALQPALDRLRKHFLASGKATYISHEEAAPRAIFHAAINSNSGRPAGSELAMLKWRPGEGAIWMTPGARLDGKLVNDLQRACRAVAADFGLEYMASFVCGARFARGIHAILYDRNDADETARADRCYRAICEVFLSRGVFVGRAPTLYQDYHQKQRAPEIVNACAAIKRALDPNGIIAPGRYGIS
ncbi:FAD-binding oxidoreductase [Pseudolabrys taiwanensis]|uniref:FAD-binding oxidoreductase n=1 Tax=Pseudolabrys taiwanensis TaxID=331696 RepID=A0A346A2W2_9HYPH|nr:FAD-binding oxidoreductase [Pseudolabrys taiwanensis]AXK83509.1 FAD-binding oxidoreductase [Pseudolabrys taiwanensis]